MVGAFLMKLWGNKGNERVMCQVCYLFIAIIGCSASLPSGVIGHISGSLCGLGLG